jgi:hypothetical protein
MSNTVRQGQSFSDKVVELTGSIENAFAMSLLNNCSITDSVAIGLDLKASEVTNHRIRDLFDENNKPATAISDHNFEFIIPDDGIGAMIIEDTFIVR